MHVNHLSGQVVDAAMKVHSILGPGLLERAYQQCLAYELVCRGIAVRKEVAMPARYEGVDLGLGYRIHLLVEECVVVEIKSVAAILPVHRAQLLSQLKLSGHRVGLLISFSVPRLKEGIVRLVNNL